MQKMTIRNKERDFFEIDAEKLIGVETKSLYIRKGILNGTLFLSQRGNGAEGKGDICRLKDTKAITVNNNLYDRIKVYAEKAEAILN